MCNSDFQCKVNGILGSECAETIGDPKFARTSPYIVHLVCIHQSNQM